MADFIIDESNADAFAVQAGGAKGCVPRDFAVQPKKMQAVNFPLIPRAEWPERIKDMEATKSRLSDIRMTGNFGGPIPALDQGQWGYCWAHSTTHAVMLLRAKANMPYVPLSAFAVAATIKNGANEGAWGALSLDFAVKRGIPSQALWPQGNADVRLGTAACWADAAKHQVTADWADLDADVWGRALTFDQMATLLLSRVPVVIDLNWWGHSICAMDLVDTKAQALRDESGKLAGLPTKLAASEVSDGYGPRILNSWTDAWGENGTAVLAGSKGVPDGAVAPLVTDA